MNERSQCQQIFSVTFRHLPRYLRGMRRRVSEHSEHALYQIGKATLFAKLALGFQLIDSEHWRVAPQGTVNQRRTIIRQASPIAKFLRYTFRCLQHGMEVIVGNQFRPAKRQNICMDATDIRSPRKSSARRTASEIVETRSLDTNSPLD